MKNTNIDRAETPGDVDAVRQLCRDFVTWQIEVFPEFRDKIETYFEPVAWNRTLAALPEIHARPGGAMLLARQADTPVGCIMYHPMAPGVAEVKRLFVAPKARGGGVASRLIEALVQSARGDGYEELRLDTAKFLAPAIALYRKHGFIDSPHAIDLPAELRSVAVFLHRMI